MTLIKPVALLRKEQNMDYKNNNGGIRESTDRPSGKFRAPAKTVCVPVEM